MSKYKVLVIERDDITITLKDGLVEFLETLVKQSQSILTIDETIDINELKDLVEARKIYSSLYGYQYTEEKTWIPKLQKMFDALT